MTELRTWVEDLLETRYDGVATRLADALGMSISAFQRSTRMGTLSVENLLRLAEETGTPAAAVLRMGGKGELADLIERLFGPSAQPDLSKSAREVARLFDALADEGAKRFYLESLRGFQAAAQQHARTAAPVDAKTAGASGKSRKRGNPDR